MTDEEALALNLYSCCGCCDHSIDDDFVDGVQPGHRRPCPEGCND